MAFSLKIVTYFEPWFLIVPLCFRLSEQATEILQMMLANILCAHLQAIDLRWLKAQVEKELNTIQTELHFSDQHIHPKLWPW